GKGYISVSDRQTSIRDTVEAALVDSGSVSKAVAKTQADKFIRDARAGKLMDPLEDLANSGVLSRMARSGAPLDTILQRLGAKGGAGQTAPRRRQRGPPKLVFWGMMRKRGGRPAPHPPREHPRQPPLPVSLPSGR